jgi:hypothetical protein
MTIEELKKAKEKFPYQYVGGGYFRNKNVPKGTNAPTFHGEQLLDEFCKFLIENNFVK